MLMQSCLRRISYLATVHRFKVRTRHIVGVENRVASYLYGGILITKTQLILRVVLKVVISMRLRYWRSFSCFLTTGKFYFTELEILELQCKKSVAHAYAVGAYKNVKLQWESYFLFCLNYNSI